MFAFAFVAPMESTWTMLITLLIGTFAILGGILVIWQREKWSKVAQDTNSEIGGPFRYAAKFQQPWLAAVAGIGMIVMGLVGIMTSLINQ